MKKLLFELKELKIQSGINLYNTLRHLKSSYFKYYFNLQKLNLPQKSKELVGISSFINRANKIIKMKTTFPLINYSIIKEKKISRANDRDEILKNIHWNQSLSDGISHKNNHIRCFLRLTKRKDLDDVMVLRILTHLYFQLSPDVRLLLIIRLLKYKIPSPLITQFTQNELRDTKYTIKQWNSGDIQILQFMSLRAKAKLAMLLEQDNSLRSHLSDQIVEVILKRVERNALSWSKPLLRWLVHQNKEPIIDQIFLNDFILRNATIDLDDRRVHLLVLMFFRRVNGNDNNYQYEAALQIYRARAPQTSDLFTALESHIIGKTTQSTIQWDQYDYTFKSPKHIKLILSRLILIESPKLVCDRIIEAVKQFPLLDSLQCYDMLRRKAVDGQLLQADFERRILEIDTKEIHYPQLRDLLRFTQMDKILLRLVADKHQGLETWQFERIMTLVMRMNNPLEVLGEYYEDNIFQEVQEYYLKNVIRFSLKFNKAMATFYKDISLDKIVEELK